MDDVLTTAQTAQLKKEMKMDSLQGILRNIRWRDYNSNRVIGDFQGTNGTDWFVALGMIVDAAEGLTYNLRGKWVDNPQWGRQFQISTYYIEYPKTTDGIYRYIVQTARWVGPAVGRNLIKQYGTDTLEILRTDPQRVASETKLITLERALEIQRKLRDNLEAEKTLVELQNILGGMGFKTLPSRAFEKWGVRAPEVIKDNPYKLTMLRGMGFPTADQIAMQRLGIPKNSMFRQQAYIEYEIKQHSIIEGDVWIPRDTLLARGLEVLGVNIHEGFEKLVGERVLVLEDTLVTLKGFDEDEKIIAAKIGELKDPFYDI